MFAEIDINPFLLTVLPSKLELMSVIYSELQSMKLSGVPLGLGFYSHVGRWIVLLSGGYWPGLVPVWDSSNNNMVRMDERSAKTCVQVWIKLIFNHFQGEGSA